MCYTNLVVDDGLDMEKTNIQTLVEKMEAWERRPGVNMSFYSQILYLGKVSLFMEFWEEDPCFGISAFVANWQ